MTVLSIDRMICAASRAWCVKGWSCYNTIFTGSGKKEKAMRNCEAPIVQMEQVWKIFQTNGQQTEALRGADLSLYPGQVLLLLGKSGSGKTTLLNLIAGLDFPTKGRIQVGGRDLQSLRERGRTQLRRHRLGFIFQFFNLLPTLTAFENVMLSVELAGKKDRQLAHRALEEVDLKGMGHRYPHELSGGEQQRVAVARALAKKPLLILADEPTGNLDTQTGDMILDLLVRRCREETTSLLMASHAQRTRHYADKVMRMEDGRLVDLGVDGD